MTDRRAQRNEILARADGWKYQDTDFRADNYLMWMSPDGWDYDEPIDYHAPENLHRLFGVFGGLEPCKRRAVVEHLIKVLDPHGYANGVDWDTVQAIFEQLSITGHPLAEAVAAVLEE
jgi:hypothetical protein